MDWASILVDFFFFFFFNDGLGTIVGINFGGFILVDLVYCGQILFGGNCA